MVNSNDANQISQIEGSLMSAHLLLPSPFQREQWPCMRDSSRKGNEIFADRKAIDLHEVNERQL